MEKTVNLRPRILVCDDEMDVLAAARLLFKGEGIQIYTVSNPYDALERIKEEEFDLVLVDLNYSQDTTSGQEGFELISRIRENNTMLPIVVMTAWATVNIAVQAMRIGANDFITKPWDNDRLLSIARNLCKLALSQRREQRLQDENKVLREENESLKFICEAPAMQAVLNMIRQIAPSDANVLLTGENGTGKSILANRIHKLSTRSKGPLISVNIGGVSESLFESELFGHVKGAFTDARADRIGRFELADGGSLILDEIGELKLDQQTTMLRLLETGEFERLGSSQTRKADVRIISATNSDLEQKVRNGSFRQDLYFRLNTVPIHVPPLRERIEDIMPLAELFLERYAQHYRKDIASFSDAAIKLLQSHNWPGNIRELDHVIERAVLITNENTIIASSLGLSTLSNQMQSLEDMSLEDIEVTMIQRAMNKHGGDPDLTAKALGISRSAFYRRLKKYKL